MTWILPFTTFTSHMKWTKNHDHVVEMEEHHLPQHQLCRGNHEGWCEILWMPTLWDVDSAARTCSESTATLGKEAMRIFFIAHPGQIDGLCCGHSLLSVYNVAFALHCPDPATPKGNWFLPLRCPFTSLSSLVFSFSLVFPFPLIFSPLWPSPLLCPSALSCLCTFFFFRTHKCLYDSGLSSSSSVLHFIRSFALVPPSGALVMPACFIASYSISKPPASLRFSIPPHTICSQFHLSPLSLCAHFFPFPFRLSCVYTLHLSNHLIVSFQSFFAVCLSLSSSTSYFLPLLSVCASTAKCYPFLLFSVCLCVLGPVLSPQLGWQIDYLPEFTT